MKQEKILKLLERDANLTAKQIAAMLGENEEEIQKSIAQFEKENIILGYKTIINWEKAKAEPVSAMIELRVTPQRGEGFDRIAERIYQYEEVASVYLMSGGFDIMVVVEGRSMKEVALFVAEKLAPMEEVLGTATHFILKKYKIDGIITNGHAKDDREVITL